MPHFYFDTRSGDEVLLDESGHEFASVEDARQTAVFALLDMAREKATNPDRLDLAIDVRGTRPCCSGHASRWKSAKRLRRADKPPSFSACFASQHQMTAHFRVVEP
ncbi:DUF6894 family protein [Neoaquamicrobium sediminum]|uniref:DUF6894 family protein n=1 Tax=Neoaquamicrobium sediminum TaxID=1849104 RepID=UPI0035E40015